MRGFLRWYGRNYDRYPYSMAFMTCFVKGSIAGMCLCM